MERRWDLTTEAFVHHPDQPDPDRLIKLGWTPFGDLWQRHFGNTISDEHADTAAELLVDALQTLEVDLADLKYTGTVSGRGQLLTLHLPELGLRRGEIPLKNTRSRLSVRAAPRRVTYCIGGLPHACKFRGQQARFDRVRPGSQRRAPVSTSQRQHHDEERSHPLRAR
ncbi:hypothetical protein [Nocardia abscessus]|uniref:hypothetical protein n=1 Tax=Nocardia abscessus TaxID=120957 RepID=UPI0024544C95|nr:hypothetical protein [Nocardia abscessus]